MCAGAGNFRRMAGPPVYGVAMCTVQGIKNVLGAVADAQPGSKPKVWVVASRVLRCDLDTQRLGEVGVQPAFDTGHSQRPWVAMLGLSRIPT
jgi:hypothetical protein